MPGTNTSLATYVRMKLKAAEEVSWTQPIRLS